MTSNHHAPYGLGYTRTTMAATTGGEAAMPSESQKSRPSSDWSLQPDSMKLESLVIADQHAAVNTFSGLGSRALYTPPVKPWEWAMPEAGGATRKGASRRRQGR